MTSFANTIAALRVYEASVAERRAAWNKVETNEDIEACVAADNAALAPVRDAYYADTQHINSRDSCDRLAYSDIKRIAWQRNPERK